MNTFSAAARWFSATQVHGRRRRDPRMSRRKRSGRSRAFAAMLEPLEDRIVLNVSYSVSGSTITFTSDSASDNLSLQTNASGALEYTDSSDTTAQSTGFTVGKNQCIIVTEPDSSGTLNLQSLKTQGGSFEVDNDVTLTGSLNTAGGKVTISGGSVTVNGNLTTGGGALTIQNTGSGNHQGDTITVNSNVVISTSSSGTAGAISLDAPTITLGSYTQLVAKGSDGGSDGSITLTADYERNDVTAAQIINEFMMIPNHDLEANISVGSDAVINGGDVSLSATTADNNWYQDFGTTGQEITSVLSTFAMPVLNNLINLLPVSVQ
jgi:hypothetical protein